MRHCVLVLKGNRDFGCYLLSYSLMCVNVQSSLMAAEIAGHVGCVCSNACCLVRETDSKGTVPPNHRVPNCHLVKQVGRQGGVSHRQQLRAGSTSCFSVRMHKKTTENNY